MFRLLLAVALLTQAVPMRAAVAVRVLLGVGDQEDTDWSGGVTARGATIATVAPWRFDTGDAMQPGNRWKMKSRRIRAFGAASAPTSTSAPTPSTVFTPTTVYARPYSSNGVIVSLTGESEDTSLEVQTPRGAFTVKLSEIPYGKSKSGLNGKA